MSKAQYDIYVDNVLKLCRRVVVKNSLVAFTMNRELVQMGKEVLELYPQTWKYYQNLAGQYHSTDRMMAVTSLDTLQTIDFTKENLALHVSTAREYALGERSFQELLGRYPDQELLIRGILNPVDIDVAIEAEDGEILHYDKDLVEENETNLIPLLSRWTKFYMQRWNNKAYFETDDLYAAAQFAGLFLLMPTTIMNIRLANCHTRFVHSFHIREYLASNGRLDVFVDHMTKKQMLWLYRNIRYIHHHAGKQDTFKWLVEYILTDRGLPLAEWSMRHDLEDQVENIYARVEFERKPLNFGYSETGADLRSVELMLDAEQPLARGNARIQREAELRITETMENSLSDKLRTKILESSVLDRTDSAPYTLSEALLNHWIYWSNTNRYTAVVTVENPRTGQSFQLTAKQAFIVFLYCYNAKSGATLVNLPVVDAQLVRRVPPPTFAELRELVLPELVGDEWIQAMVDALGPTRDLYVSTAAFNDDVRLINKGQLRSRDLYCAQEHLIARGQMEVAMLRGYEDIECDFGAATTYVDWFADRGLDDLVTLTDLEAEILSNQILEKATGADLRKVDSLKEMQAAMLRLMTQLSSYSVQYLQDINDSPIHTVEWPVIRVGDTDVEAFDHQQVEVIDVGVEDYDLLGTSHEFLDLSVVGIEIEPHISADHHDVFEVDLITEQASKLGMHSHVHIAWIDVLDFRMDVLDVTQGTDDRTTVEYQPNELVPLENVFTTLMSPHYALTDEEHQIILDRWALYQPGDLWIDIATLIHTNWFSDFRPQLGGLIVDRWFTEFVVSSPETVINLPGFQEETVIDLPGFAEETIITLPGFQQETVIDLPGFGAETIIDLPGFEI